MKIHAKREMPSAEADMTPMIDMTFQLIAFFMVLINFSDAETNERIRLPSSELAKPPDGPTESPITLQLTREGTVLYAGDELPVKALKSYMDRERQVLERLRKSPAAATVVIRADIDAKTGDVQELIKIAQDAKFEKFVMRAVQQESNP